MQRMKIFAVAFVLLGALAISATAKEKSLYDRLGGKKALTAVVDAFVGKAAADTRINAKFGKTDVPRLKEHLVEQLCFATGGPCKYTGNDMKTAHHNMKVTEGEFNALVEDLVATLDQFKVPEKEKGELLAILGPLKDQIVEVKSNDTGTPLPSDFKPAPPLKGKKGGN